ncbi:hypothetical protein H4S08_002146 [Coemansia sp. RSA 1365]|nr:hypothetical protein H4S08_002146 [Coemansia sp. RSA 1365]
MRASLVSSIVAAFAGIQLAIATPIPNDTLAGAGANALAIRYVPPSVDWNAVDWNAINWNAIKWSSVFSIQQEYKPQATAVQVAAEAVPNPYLTLSTESFDTYSNPEPSPAPNPSPNPEPYQPSTPSRSPLWGLTYSPYNDDGSCPDVGTVASQLQKVASVTSNIRLYSTDCSQLSSVMQAISDNKLALAIHAGIWLSDGGARMESDLEAFISAAKMYDSSLIKGVSVGNEDISKGMSESTLIGYINQVRARLQAEGMGHIPVYTTEQDAKFTKGMADASDLVQINVYSIFDNTFSSVDSSVKSVIQRADAVKTNIAGGKQVRIGESGWSSSGNTGPCPLSLANELEFAQRFKCAATTAGYDYFYFEAKDALWKQNADASEKSFGIFNSGYTAKFDFGLLNTC